MSVEVLSIIDAQVAAKSPEHLANRGSARTDYDALVLARAEIVRLTASAAEDRAALTEASNDAEVYRQRMRAAEAALAPEPPTDDEREALARIVEDGFEVEDEPRATADAILASDVWRNRGRGPITDEAVTAAWNVLKLDNVGHYSRRNMRAALEAARDAEAGR